MKDVLGMIALALGGVVVLLIAMNILWNKKYRPMQMKKGRPTPMFNDIVKRVIKFVFVEDREPYAKVSIKFVNRKTTYLALLVLSFVAILVGKVAVGAVFLFVLIIVITARTRGVFAPRSAILTRMYEVAASEFRYARGSELNPWGFVQIKEWETLTVPGETVVQFPAAFRSDDPKKREDFENHFNGTLGGENTWIYRWDSPQGIVRCLPVSHVPTMAKYEGSKGEWNEIPMGLGPEGPVVWDIAAAPHILICGTTGGGKSVTQRTIIFHCIQHSDRWRFLGVDLKRVELSGYKQYDDVVLGIATELADGVEVMRFGKEEMMNRYAEMEEYKVDHFLKLPNPPMALMIMVDEAYMFMAPTGLRTDVGKEMDELHGEATTLIGEIARLGRAAGVHLVLATQRPDAKVIYGEIKQNLAARYAAGRMGSTASQMVLDSDGATRIPGEVKGRAILSINGDEQPLQGYFAEQTWIDTWRAEKSTGSGASRANALGDGMSIELPEDLGDGEIEDRFTRGASSSAKEAPVSLPVAMDDDDYDDAIPAPSPAVAEDAPMFSVFPAQQAANDSPATGMRRPDLAGKPPAVREEDEWDDGMESVFSFIDNPVARKAPVAPAPSPRAPSPFASPLTPQAAPEAAPKPAPALPRPVSQPLPRPVSTPPTVPLAGAPASPARAALPSRPSLPPLPPRPSS